MEKFQVYRDIQARTGGDIYIGVVVFLQPGNDDGGVQTAGVRQNYLFDVFLILFHDELPSLFLRQDARGMLLAVCLEYLFIHCCILYTLLYILQEGKPAKGFSIFRFVLGRLLNSYAFMQRMPFTTASDLLLR